MSFTAEVKEELSRVVTQRSCCPRAELSALPSGVATDALSLMCDVVVDRGA